MFLSAFSAPTPAYSSLLLPGSRLLSTLRTLALVVMALVYVASWPGAALRAVSVELVAPALPPTVEGREGVLDVVVHAAGGAVTNARVRAFAILDGRAYAAGEASTDRAGRASLRALPPAEHWVVAEAGGHARASQMVVVVAGARRLDLELEPEHRLEVEVKDDAGGAVPGAELEVRATDPFPVGARTGAGGAATVGRLGAGPFSLVVRAPGYEEVTRRNLVEGKLVSIVLGKQGALLVDVVGEDGQPVPAARVLLAAAGLGSTRSADTDAQGHVRIAGLDRGSYALRAVSGTRISTIDLGLVLEKGEEKHVTLTLRPGLVVPVHVVDGASEEDVRDARVTLTEAGLSPFPIEGVTDRAGRVALGPIAPGPATVAARADGFVPRPAVPVADGGPTTISLARGGTVVGTIRDARGYAIDGATIRIIGTDLEGMPIDEDPARWTFREAHFTAALGGPAPLVPAGELGVMPGPVPVIPHEGPSVGLSFGAPVSPRATVEAWVSSRDGSFRATPVTPGRVRALVRHPQFVEAMSELVTLASSAEVRVDLVLQRGGTLEGRVVDARGRGVSGAHVTALATRGSAEHATRTGTDGSFGFASLPDAVTLLVARAEDPTAIVARAEVVVPEAGKKTIEIALPEPRPPLAVRVTDARGSGLEAAQISAVAIEAGESLRTTAFSDGRGRAELNGGRGIALRVEVRAPGRAAKIVTTTAETTELVVVLATAESLAGEVTTRRRDAIANADVTVQTEAGVRHARTAKDGTFTVGDLTAGPAKIRVREPGHAPEERATTIEAKDGRRPTELPRIELREEGIVEGEVVDGRGDPVPGARVARDAVPTYLPVGGAVGGMAVADGRGRFKLAELAEGTVTLEAYAPDVGRGRRTDVRVLAGRTTDRVKIVLQRGEPTGKEPIATGGVAVTLGETPAGYDMPEVVVVAVAEGSEAERAGLLVNDVLVEVAGTHPATIADARQRLAGPVHDDVLVKVRRGERVIPLRVAREAVRR